MAFSTDLFQLFDALSAQELTSIAVTINGQKQELFRAIKKGARTPDQLYKALPAYTPTYISRLKVLLYDHIINHFIGSPGTSIKAQLRHKIDTVEWLIARSLISHLHPTISSAYRLATDTESFAEQLDILRLESLHDNLMGIQQTTPDHRRKGALACFNDLATRESLLEQAESLPSFPPDKRAAMAASIIQQLRELDKPLSLKAQSITLTAKIKSFVFNPYWEGIEKEVVSETRALIERCSGAKAIANTVFVAEVIEFALWLAERFVQKGLKEDAEAVFRMAQEGRKSLPAAIQQREGIRVRSMRYGMAVAFANGKKEFLAWVASIETEFWKQPTAFKESARLAARIMFTLLDLQEVATANRWANRTANFHPATIGPTHFVFLKIASLAISIELGDVALAESKLNSLRRAIQNKLPASAYETFIIQALAKALKHYASPTFAGHAAKLADQYQAQFARTEFEVQAAFFNLPAWLKRIASRFNAH